METFRADVEQGRPGCAPEPGRGGCERLACCADACERVLRAQHHGVRAAGPGEFEPRVDQAVAASAQRPLLPLRLVHLGC